MRYEYSEDDLIELTAIELFNTRLGWNKALAYNKETCGESGTPIADTRLPTNATKTHGLLDLKGIASIDNIHLDRVVGVGNNRMFTIFACSRFVNILSTMNKSMLWKIN